MGLKDLIASKSSLAEDVIEEIVSEYVRYDTDHKAVFLTPEGHELSGKSKVLIYLVALQGWPFVMDDVVPTDAKPGEIEEHTAIPGGTLRPLLKEWLVKYKFKNWKVTQRRKVPVTRKMKEQRAEEIAGKLNDTRLWHSHGRGIQLWSMSASATPCSRSKSTNRRSSQSLFRISTANL